MKSFGLTLPRTGRRGQKRSPDQSDLEGGRPVCRPHTLYPAYTGTNQEGNLIDNVCVLWGPSEYLASGQPEIPRPAAAALNGSGTGFES